MLKGLFYLGYFSFFLTVDHLGLQMKPEALRTHSDSQLEAEIHKYVQANSEKCYYLCFKWILLCTLAFCCILVYLWDAPCTGNRSSPCSSFFSPRILNSRLFKSVLAFFACCSAASCDGWGCCGPPSSWAMSLSDPEDLVCLLFPAWHNCPWT